MPLVNFVRIVVPDVIPTEAIRIASDRILTYPGIKEDVYAPDFSPEPTLLSKLGIEKE